MISLRSVGAALVILFLAAHLAWLPRTLEDLDSVNFALGVRDFDVAKHQPHPPGYPVYIAVAKASTGTLRLIGVEAAAPRGLAIWSAIGGALALPAIVIFFRRLEGRPAVAAWSTLLVAACPLFWFTSLRPLSDMLGFAASMWVLALAAGAVRGAGSAGSAGSKDPAYTSLAAAALLAGLAIGIRSQTAVLTLPFLVYVAFTRRSAAAIVSVAAGVAAGAIAWGVPLLIASGGPSSYLHALSFQAGADFEGVVMLWTHHSRREVLTALVNTFVWPWDWRVGIVMCVLAAAGALRIAWRSPRAAAALAVAFVPYAVFHLLFQETVTTRYAVPLVPVVAYAALAALEGLPGRAMQGAAIGLAVLSLAGAIPASSRYAHEGAPIFRAFDDMAATAHGGDRVDVIGMHAIARRPAEWSAPILPARIAPASHGREWLALIDVWKTNPAARIWFAADPARTDLALFDPHAREIARAYTWGFTEPPFVGGARPNDVDWLHMAAPGWMLDKGWSLTAEVGGVTARDHAGPARAPAVAWLKRRADAMTVVVGGRHIGAGTATAALRLNGAPLETFQIPPGFFVRLLTLPAGALGGDAAYHPLEVTSVGEVSLEQFDAQPPGVPMFAYDRGWHEPEFNLSQARAWRWTSESSDLWIRPIGRPLTLRIVGENPLRYFDAAPRVRVIAGGRELAAFDPAADFEQTITVPPDVLEAAGGKVTMETSKFFVPGGGGDQRHLALRVYRVSVE